MHVLVNGCHAHTNALQLAQMIRKLGFIRPATQQSTDCGSIGVVLVSTQLAVLDSNWIPFTNQDLLDGNEQLVIRLHPLIVAGGEGRFSSNGVVRDWAVLPTPKIDVPSEKLIQRRP